LTTMISCSRSSQSRLPQHPPSLTGTASNKTIRHSTHTHATCHQLALAASVTHLVPKSRFLTRSASLDTPAISSLPQPSEPPPCGNRTNSHIQQTWPNQNDALRIGLDATLTAAKLSKNKAAEPYRLTAAILRQQPVWTEADPSHPQTAIAACSFLS